MDLCQCERVLVQISLFTDLCQCERLSVYTSLRKGLEDTDSWWQVTKLLACVSCIFQTQSNCSSVR